MECSGLACATLNQLGSPIVAMVQPSKAWVRHDSTGSRGGSSASRCLLRKTKMRAVFMVVTDVFKEQPFQMVFIERDDMMQQRAAPSLCSGSVGLGTILLEAKLSFL
jgi:hypothetical protein